MWFLGLYIRKENKKISTEEFRDIFMELYPELCLFALKFVNDIESSKDIVQDVLGRFWLESEKLNHKSQIKSYLYSSVKNRALNFKKREKRKIEIDELLNGDNYESEQTDTTDAISHISFNKLQEELSEAIEQLPEQRKLIFTMSRFQQLKHKEIAEKLNISVKTVETQIYRSLLFLQKRLRHYLDER